MSGPNRLKLSGFIKESAESDLAKEFFGKNKKIKKFKFWGTLYLYKGQDMNNHEKEWLEPKLVLT